MPRAIVDTNVAVVANQASPQASLQCVKACILRLLELRNCGMVIIDTDWKVIREYKNNLSESGQPGVGDQFLLWVLQNWRNPGACERHALTADCDREDTFLEFPQDPQLANFDVSDRKFAALAAVSGAPVWNAVDSDWWQYRDALERNHIRIDFLCPDCFEGR